MSSGFQSPGFQSPGFQTAVLAPVDEDMQDVLGRVFRFRPPALPFVTARIHQTLPALTQHATVTVSDDELVLLLL